MVETRVEIVLAKPYSDDEWDYWTEAERAAAVAAMAAKGFYPIDPVNTPFAPRFAPGGFTGPIGDLTGSDVGVPEGDAAFGLGASLPDFFNGKAGRNTYWWTAAGLVMFIILVRMSRGRR